MIALAVIAVGLIAIVGLIPQGIQSSRSAADNTLVATIVHDVFNTVRSQPFNNVNLSTFGFAPAGPYALQNPYVGLEAYFDSSGFTPVTAADRYYRVVLNFQPDVTLPLTLVTATVTWPAKSAPPPTPINSAVFFTQIANYQ